MQTGISNLRNNGVKLEVYLSYDSIQSSSSIPSHFLQTLEDRRRKTEKIRRYTAPHIVRYKRPRNFRHEMIERCRKRGSSSPRGPNRTGQTDN